MPKCEKFRLETSAVWLQPVSYELKTEGETCQPVRLRKTILEVKLKVDHTATNKSKIKLEWSYIWFSIELRLTLNYRADN